MRQRNLFSLLGWATIGMVSLLVWLLQNGHEQAVQRATGDADNLVQALRGQFVATLRRLDGDMHTVATQIPAQALQVSAIASNTERIEPLLRLYTQRFPELGGLFVWDARGSFLYGTHRPGSEATLTSIASREPFQELLRTDTLSLLFSDVIRGVVTGHRVVSAYLAIRDPQGRLLGVVSGTLDLDRLSQSFELLQMPRGSVIFVRRADTHHLMLRDPPIEAEVNRPVSNSIQRRIDAGEVEGRDRFTAVTDGESRLYGFRRMEDYPYYVVVGLSEHAALADWRRNALIVVIALAGMSLVLALSWVRVRRDEAQRLAAQHDATQAHVLLQDAINSVATGMIIYDDHDRFLICNQAQRAMFPGVGALFQEGLTFSELLDLGLERGVFRLEPSEMEAWRVQRLRHFRRADGRPMEVELSHGEWVQWSEHRTALGYTVGIRIDITERKRVESELRQQASTDGLTALPNRRYFFQRLDAEIERVRRGSTREACLLVLDLDYFKQVNDRFGHAVGDQLLRHFSQMLRQELRSSDVAGRLGGEEFGVLLAGSSDMAAKAWAQRICDSLAQNPMQVDGGELSATVSVGITGITPQDRSADFVFARADAALYRAKDNGRNRVEISYDAS